MSTYIHDAATLTGWRKSSYSGAQGDCVEVIDGYSDGTPVRDSKAPHGPALVFPSAGWASFVSAIKAGHIADGEVVA